MMSAPPSPVPGRCAERAVHGVADGARCAECVPVLGEVWPERLVEGLGLMGAGCACARSCTRRRRQVLEGVHTLEVDAPGWYFEQVKLDVHYKGTALKVRPSLNGENGGGSKVCAHPAPPLPAHAPGARVAQFCVRNCAVS